METLILIGIGAAVGLILAVSGWFLWKTGYNSGYNSANGRAGRNVQADRNVQAKLALLRIRELHEAKTPPLEIARTVVMEYPDVAFQALRDLQKLAKEMGIQEGI